MKIDLKLPGGGEIHVERERKPVSGDTLFGIGCVVSVAVFLGFFLILFWIFR